MTALCPKCFVFLFSILNLPYLADELKSEILGHVVLGVED
jgi:hypothetical protein